MRLIVPHRPAIVVILSMFIVTAAFASSPSSGSLSATGTSISFNGTASGGVSQDAEASCTEGTNCDTFTLTLAGAPSDWSGKGARVSISWLLPATDYDFYVHKGTVTGPVVTSSAEGATTKETAIINPAVDGTGTFVVHVVYFVATNLDQYKGSAAVELLPAAPPHDPVSVATPTYDVFAPPATLGQSAGEPSIGVNWKTGATFFQASLETLKVAFDDAAKTSTWTDKTGLTTGIVSFDPILYTDPKTGRTFVSQLLPTKVSLMAFTDNDGETWTQSQGSGINSGVDHQTIGGGPFKAGTLLGPTSSYPNAIYYASQDIGLAEIALSRDGGQTFGVAVPMYNLLDCTGLHGHIQVAPDGTVYVPNKSCSGKQAVVVSEDNGLTWNVRHVPGSLSGDTDPSVGIGSDGTIYFAYANGDGKQRVAVSHDRGLTWVNDRNIGESFGILNSVFPAATAGDPDRAAVFFLGSTTEGANGRDVDMSFNGTWYGYMATTYDGGSTWMTVNATPDPVQRGVICTSGTTCPDGTRNLLDFNGLVIDGKGRTVAAFADGCTSDACKQGVDRSGPNGTPDGKIDSYDNDGSESAAIIRQASSRSVFAAYDEPSAPSGATATLSKGIVTLKWADNSANETYFVVERSLAADSGFSTVASLGANMTSWVDNTVSKKNAYYYRVRATNANGSSPSSNTVRIYVK